MDIPQHATLAKHTKHVGTCAVAITNIQSLEQDAEAPCVDIGRRCKFEAKNDKSFGLCTSMTATEHVVEDETPPLAVEPAEVGLKRSASVSATAGSDVRKK
jgi:hypothetical protein